MSRYHALLALAVLSLAATPTRGDAQAATPRPVTQVTTPDHFRPMEFLVGSCWIGTFPNSAATDEHCFEWVYDRKFIRDRHVVRNAATYEGETLYALKDKGQPVEYWYWSSSGGLSTGTMEPRGDRLEFPERHVRGDTVIEIRSSWKRTGPDSFLITSERKRGTEWTTLWTMDMKRSRPAGKSGQP